MLDEALALQHQLAFLTAREAFPRFPFQRPFTSFIKTAKLNARSRFRFITPFLRLRVMKALGCTSWLAWRLGGLSRSDHHGLLCTCESTRIMMVNQES
jgi:hypothetical protein